MIGKYKDKHEYNSKKSKIQLIGVSGATFRRVPGWEKRHKGGGYILVEHCKDSKRRKKEGAKYF